jgi:hypothetical protein
LCYPRIRLLLCSGCSIGFGAVSAQRPACLGLAPRLESPAGHFSALRTVLYARPGKLLNPGRGCRRLVPALEVALWPAPSAKALPDAPTNRQLTFTPDHLRGADQADFAEIRNHTPTNPNWYFCIPIEHSTYRHCGAPTCAVSSPRPPARIFEPALMGQTPGQDTTAMKDKPRGQGERC